VAHARKASPGSAIAPPIASVSGRGRLSKKRIAAQTNPSGTRQRCIHVPGLANRYEVRRVRFDPRESGDPSPRAALARRRCPCRSIWSRRADGNRPGSRCPSARHRCLQRRELPFAPPLSPGQQSPPPACARLVPDESDRYRPRRRLARFFASAKKPFSERQTARVFPELEAESTCSASPASPGAVGHQRMQTIAIPQLVCQHAKTSQRSIALLANRRPDSNHVTSAASSLFGLELVCRTN